MSAMPARETAERWLAAEPDADMRDELAALLAGVDDTLEDRFTGRLQFGTAGLRAAVGAGPLRMNRLVVQQAAAGLVDYLLAAVPRRRGEGRDHRLRRPPQERPVRAGHGPRVRRPPGEGDAVRLRQVPTPVLAWNITALGAAAGVMVTASHNPPADNGYKVYLGTGSQIVPPADTDISARIDAVDPCAVALSPPPTTRSSCGSAMPRWRPTSPRFPPSVCGPMCPACRWPTRPCTASVGPPWWRRSTWPGCRRRPWWPNNSSPTARSPRCRSPTRRSPGRWIC